MGKFFAGALKSALEIDRQDNSYGNYHNHGHVHDDVTLETQVMNCILAWLLENMLIPSGNEVVKIVRKNRDLISTLLSFLCSEE